MRIIKVIWKFINSNFGLLFLGFILTTILGTYFTESIQRKSRERQIEFEIKRQNFEWERNRKFEILKRKIDDGEKSLEEISDLINLRYFRLHNVFSNILAKDINSARQNWKEYIETVEIWNVKLIINQNKLERLVSKEVSLEFNNYETDIKNLHDAKSIHGKFFIAHNNVLSLLDCLKNPSCTIAKKDIQQTNEILRDLDYHTDFFIDKISNLFLQRAYELENFDITPESLE